MQAKFIVTTDTIISADEIDFIKIADGDNVIVHMRSGQIVKTSMAKAGPDDIPLPLLRTLAQLSPELIAASDSWLRRALGLDPVKDV